MHLDKTLKGCQWVNYEEKNLSYYLSLPWEFEFQKAPEGGFYARVKGLPCHSHGCNMEEATKNIKEALESYIEGSIEENLPIIEPVQSKLTILGTNTPDDPNSWQEVKTITTHNSDRSEILTPDPIDVKNFTHIRVGLI